MSRILNLMKIVRTLQNNVLRNRCNYQLYQATQHYTTHILVSDSISVNLYNLCHSFWHGIDQLFDEILSHSIPLPNNGLSEVI